jgi:glycosyltransferase involved in cell wall biosynthesis
VVKRVAAAIPTVSAMICGNGPEEPKLREQLLKAAIGQHLTMTGIKMERPEVLQLLRQSKILLHPSSYEGFGMVNLEALVAGAHVISFTKPMHNDIEHWHVVKDEAAMAAKAIELLQDKNTVYTSLLPYPMDDTAIQVMRLFGLQPEK